MDIQKVLDKANTLIDCYDNKYEPLKDIGYVEDCDFVDLIKSMKTVIDILLDEEHCKSFLV